MSVAAFCGGKRFYQEEGEDRQLADANKRSRHQQQGSPISRCAFQHPHQTLGASVVAALHGLFPEMKDQVIASVLAEYGDNVDAAIKHLTELRLSATATAAAASASNPASQPAQAQQRPAQPEQGQVPTQHSADAAPSAAPAPAPTAKSAEQWVDTIVQQMADAADLPDARRRAGALLQAFEQAVLQHSGQAQGAAASDAGQPGPSGAADGTDSLGRENALLKRAVAIQSVRLQELGARDAEATGLRHALAEAQQRAAALEMQCYSLQLHLRAAAAEAARHGGRGPPPPPDIF